jgi:hypothetical protein
MLPSRRARLRTYFLRTDMNPLKGHMLCRNTGPGIVISFTRCTRRWVVILKNEGGNVNSKLTRHCTTSFCSLPRFLGSVAFCEIALRNAQSFMALIVHSLVEHPSTQLEATVSSTCGSCGPLDLWTSYLWYLLSHLYSISSQMEPSDCLGNQTWCPSLPCSGCN